MAKNYVLESQAEFERLERQSRMDAYDFRRELEDWHPRKTGSILDAGCGSGIVSRYLSERFPTARVVGCDSSEHRVRQAADAARGRRNLEFAAQDLRKLGFSDATFDSAVCRFVLQHLEPEGQRSALAELHRVLKPGGSLRVVDIDGFLFNLHPQTPLISDVLERFDRQRPLDFRIGRRLPSLLAQTGFGGLDWRVEPMVFKGPSLDGELVLLEQRFDQASAFLAGFLGSEDRARAFRTEYMSCARSPNAVLFYDKFVVTGKRPGLAIVA